MSVANSIYGALQRFGRPMVLRRETLVRGAIKVPLEIAVFGTSKNYTPQELIGTIVQGDSEVTITNAEIAAAQWPGPPRALDYIVIEGKPRTIKAVESKYLGTEILVHVCQVTG